MRRHLIIGAAVAAALVPSVSAHSATADSALTLAARPTYNGCGYHPTTTIHLRSGPAQRYTSLGLLEPADDVYADRTSGGWYRVSLSGDSANGLGSGRTGWVMKKHLKAQVCMQLD
ncbi:SH3 domain-containing protein [Streptomyces liangshanensis]|uniref:hypothetical protein n=1 Tax=Streptomyces liangshanensis TaxID=2717324 RepID=UPI0036DC404F